MKNIINQLVIFLMHAWIVLLFVSCGGASSNSETKITPNLNAVSIATGSYIYAQSNSSSQTINIPVYNNSGANVTISLLESATNPLNVALGTCSNTLINTQVCYLTVSLAAGAPGNGIVTIPLLVNNQEKLYTSINWVRINNPLTQPGLYAQSIPLIASNRQTVFTSFTFVNNESQLSGQSEATIQPVNNLGSWHLISDQCGPSISANKTCSIIVSFTNNNTNLNSNQYPSAIITKASANSGIVALPLANYGTSQLAGIPSVLNLYNQPESSVNLILNNSGNIPITGISITNTSGVSVDYSACSQVLPLDAFSKEACLVVVKLLTPSGKQSVTINYSDANGSHSQIVTVDYDSWQLSPSDLSFAGLVNNFIQQSIVFQNLGSNNLTLATNLITNPSNLQPDFSLSCPSLNLASGTNLDCRVGFNTAGGVKTSANLSYSATDLISESLTQTQNAQINVQQAPIISSNVGKLNFTNNLVDFTYTESFILSNTGQLTANNLNLISALPLGFSLSNNCNSISSNESCVMTLSYKPTSLESQVESFNLDFSYNYQSPAGTQVTTSTGNITNITYSSANAVNINCNQTTQKINLGTYYWADPNSSLTSSIVCINRGESVAVVDWSKLKAVAGYTITVNGSSSSPINVGSQESLTFVVIANPDSVSGAAPIDLPEINYVSQLGTQSASALLAQQIKYTTIPWYTVNLISPCNNVLCGLQVTNNSPDSVSLAGFPVSTNYIAVSKYPCTQVAGNESCTFNISLSPNMDNINLTIGESNTYTISAANASKPLTYQFNYLANEIIYIGGSFVNNGNYTNYIAYYHPYESGANIGMYCLAGYTTSGLCKSGFGIHTINALLYNSINGGLYVGTLQSGALFSYNGVDFNTQPSLLAAQENSSVMGLVLSSNYSSYNGVVASLMPVGGTTSTFQYPNSNAWVNYPINNGATPGNNQIITMLANYGGLVSGFILAYGATSYYSSNNLWSGWYTATNPINALTSGYDNTGNWYLFTGVGNAPQYQINTAATQSFTGDSITNTISSATSSVGGSRNYVVFLDSANQLHAATYGNNTVGWIVNGPTATSSGPIVVDNNGTIYLISNSDGKIYKSDWLYGSGPQPLVYVTSIANNPSGALVATLGYQMLWSESN